MAYGPDYTDTFCTLFDPSTPSLFAQKKSKKDGEDQETIQSSTTPDPVYHRQLPPMVS